MSNTLDQDHIHNDATFGQFGFRKLSGSANSFPKEKFCAIHALADTELKVDVGGKGDKTFTDTITAGTVIYGDFTNIDLTSGKVVAYLIE